MSITKVLAILGQPIDTACTLIETLLGEPFKIAGDALSDHVRMWQWKNRLQIMDRADQIMRLREIEKRELYPDFFLPFVRDCGDISSELLQETWARLLTAAVDDESSEHIAFVNALRSLNATDVQVVDCMISLGYLNVDQRPKAIAERLSMPLERVKLAIYNLEHLGFFTPTQKRLKGFSVHLLRACICKNQSLDSYLAEQNAIERNIITD